MTRNRVAFLVLSLVLTLPLLGGALWSTVVRNGPDDGGDSLYKYLAMFSEVFGLVRSDYVDPTDAETLLSGAMEGATDALDPFAVFVPREAAATFDKALAVGRSLSGLTVVRDHGVAYVLAVEAGSPGAAAGFESGDILADVDGHETHEMPRWQLEHLLADAPGEELVCKVVRQGDTREIRIGLAAYAPPAPSLEQTGGFPMLRIPSFDAGVAERVRPLAEQLAAQGAPKLLVDLRSIAGGPGRTGYQVAKLFATGDLGTLAARSRTEESFHGDAAPVWKGEIVVLVDGGTQGPAEVLAAALRQRAGARLVGVRTFGYAGERHFVDLDDGARLLLTRAFYTAPDGTALSKGLAPDLLVDDLQRSFGERDKPLSDLILERGIELLEGRGPAVKAAA